MGSLGGERGRRGDQAPFSEQPIGDVPQETQSMTTPQLISLAIAALYALHVIAEVRHW
jgi:hypothetical protein